MKAKVKIKSNIGNIAIDKKGKIQDVVNDTLLNIQAGAKLRSPVDTGHLKRNINVEKIDDLNGKVSTRVEYAPFVEFGTSKSPAQPFLFPAAEDERPEFLAKIKKVMSEK